MKKSILSIIFIPFLTACSAQSSPSAPSASPSAQASLSPTLAASASPDSLPEEKIADPLEETPVSEPQKTLIGKAVTQLLDKGRNRMNNIRLAAEQISGIQILPNESFSFNEVVGERSAAAGYEPAPVIIDGEKESEYGGGVCQLATTVMQAASVAELNITERHDHQKNVGYAEQGEDAAVQYGLLDMKFVNNTDRPIEIDVSVGTQTVGVEIYRLNR